MTNPRVCAVMLVDGRPEMVWRALNSFFRQTYEDKKLLIYDTGEVPYANDWSDIHDIPWRTNYMRARRYSIHEPGEGRRKVGELRNAANAEADTDIIVHWDSDDWSAPERIAEQVELLVGSGKLKHHPLAPEVCGYSDMLFWDTRPIASAKIDPATGKETLALNEAWLYTGSPRYMLGSSLCYWRDTWKRKPFPAKNQGEDTQWQMGLQSLSVKSTSIKIFVPGIRRDETEAQFKVRFDAECKRVYQESIDHPNSTSRMVCSIHGGNIASHVDQRSRQWRRVPEWDDYCRKVMA